MRSIRPTRVHDRRISADDGEMPDWKFNLFYVTPLILLFMFFENFDDIWHHVILPILKWTFFIGAGLLAIWILLALLAAIVRWFLEASQRREEARRVEAEELSRKKREDEERKKREAERRRQQELDQKRQQYEETLNQRAQAYAAEPGYIRWYQCRFRNQSGSGRVVFALFAKEPAMRMLFGYIGSSWHHTEFEEFVIKSKNVIRVDYLDESGCTVIFTRDKRHPGIELYWNNRDLYYQILQCMDGIR